METRRIKAEQIVKTKQITKTEKNKWLVPSQSGNGKYTVVYQNGRYMCNCLDYEHRGQPCKHAQAVMMTVLSWFDKKGNKILEVKRVSYPQNWAAYNTAQTNEKDLFMKLLSDLCVNVENKEIPVGRAGRHGLQRKDMVFVSALKVYTTFSLRRFMTDMRNALEKGYLTRICSYSSVSNYMRDEELTSILQKLIYLSAMPLKSVETKFAIDSSGFRTTKFNDYCKDRYMPDKKHNWIKMHICTGVKTNIITAVEIGQEHHSADSPQFIPLSQKTYENGFKIEEMSADKAYSSRNNLAYIDERGGVPYILFRNDAVGKPRGKNHIWRRMYDFYTYRREEFLEHYHSRSNVESTFNMVKAKFTDLIRSKDKTAQINEALLKVFCHNIVVLIQSINELGIEPNFIQNGA